VLRLYNLILLRITSLKNNKELRELSLSEINEVSGGHDGLVTDVVSSIVNTPTLTLNEKVGRVVDKINFHMRHLFNRLSGTQPS